MADRTKATRWLKAAFGPKSEFRDGQWEAIEAALKPAARHLVVQAAGWGKSAVYLIPARILRERGSGPVVIVSPLVALMRNQVAMAGKLGVRADQITAADAASVDRVLETIGHDELDVLYVSPERFANSVFNERILPLIEHRIPLLVLDEAHCLTEWGFDFRPDYLRVRDFIARLPADARVLATTATATERVLQDLTNIIGNSLAVQRGSLVRSNLRLKCFQIDDYAERLAWLAKYLPRIPGSGLIYTLTVEDAERAAEFLQTQDLDVRAYHADLDHETRVDLELKLDCGEIKGLACTSALGMGYDAPDLGFVIHFGAPPSLMTYYQQVGRAGRGSEPAWAALLWGQGDMETLLHFAESGLPEPAAFDNVLGSITAKKVGFRDLMPIADFETLDRVLTILESEHAIDRTQDGLFVRGPKPFDFERFRERQAWKRDEAAQVFLYARPPTQCRMQLLLSALGERRGGACKLCDFCAPTSHEGPPADLVRAAEGYLRSLRFTIFPKKSLVRDSFLDREAALAKDELAEVGFALCGYNDPTYGEQVRAGKFHLSSYPDELLEPFASEVLASGYEPEWVAWVPSARSQKVEDFARRVAKKLGIPAIDALEKIRATAPQKDMVSKRAQLRNVWRAFRAKNVLPGRCLLVDDIVDSGWTFTVCALELRKAGAAAVMPAALATARPRRSK